jgi:hypothetical protein
VRLAANPALSHQRTPAKFVGMRQRPSTVDPFTVRSRPHTGQTSGGTGPRRSQDAFDAVDTGLSPPRSIVSVGWHRRLHTRFPSMAPPGADSTVTPGHITEGARG